MLEGHSVVGGTKLHIEDKGRGFLIDFGLCFAKYGKYFDSLLRPRGVLGAYDAWQLGILPAIEDIYRLDAMSQYRTFEGRRLPVEACALSHAHVDHVGLLGYLDRRIELHASSVTAAILRATQTSGVNDMAGEATRYVPRLRSKYDPRGLSVSASDTIVRPLVLSHGDVTPQLDALWNTSQGRSVSPTRIKEHTGEIAGVPYEAWPVDHSIYGGLAYIFHTSAGAVCYTGDLRFSGRFGHLSQALVARLEEVRPEVLIVEGTRVGRPAAKNATEEDVATRAREIIQRAPGLVVADYGARHLERAETFLNLAKAFGRRLVLTAKDVLLMESVMSADPQFSWLDDSSWHLYNAIRAQPKRWEREIKQRYAGRLIDADDIHRNQSSFVLAMSLFDMPEMLSIRANSPTWIYSSSEAYDEGAVLNLGRLNNWIDHLGGSLHGFTWDDENGRGCPRFGNTLLNASGHLSESELESLLKRVKARRVIPCHTGNPTWFREVLRGEPTQVVLASDG